MERQPEACDTTDPTHGCVDQDAYTVNMNLATGVGGTIVSIERPALLFDATAYAVLIATIGSGSAYFVLSRRKHATGAPPLEFNQN